jgi:uncharacterized repeat protein (TIGR01451 family)
MQGLLGTSRRRWVSALWGLGLLAQAAPARAAITTVPIATVTGSPVDITSPHDGSGRLFITVQQGRVMIHDGCVLLGTPFLDISSLVEFGGERGLLSIAFHPAFPATPYFYVYYTNAGDADIVIARYRVQAGNPNLADPSSGVILLTIPHPGEENHNGGQLQFGPDGYLYFGTGDGGGGADPNCNSQRDDTLLGKMLRLDVNQNFNTPPYFGIPPTNPFAGSGDPLDKVWAKGMRNPFRFSFDRTTGDLFIGDVGEDTFEEVDFQAAGAPGGRNYGWRVMEGTLCTGYDNSVCPGNPPLPPACNDPAYTLPILEYDHNGGPLGRCSIAGGYRYRGTQVAGLAGTYVYGDLCSGDIFGGTLDAGTWTSTVLIPAIGFFISTFGEDEVGELYVADLFGTIYKIVDQNSQANLSITKTDGQTAAVPGQPLTYTIAVGNAGPAAANSAMVNDTFPAALQNVNWTCSASPGSSCCSIVGGNTVINRPVYVLPGGTVTYTATATLSAAATGTVSNTATVTAPSGITDPAAANNSATDVDTVGGQTDLAITKTDGRTTVAPGQAVTYTITASNPPGAAQQAATGVTVTDVVPAALTGATWTCAGAGGGTCTPGPVSGNISDTVSLVVGSSVTYTLSGTVAAAPSSLRNTATVAVPAGLTDPNPANNAAQDDDTLICNGETVVVADGRLGSGVIGAGATVWYGSHLKIGDSYSWEFKNLTGTTPPGTATFFAGDDGCSLTSTLTPRDTTTLDPGAPTTARRVSFVAAGTETFFRARLVNSGSSIPYSFSVTDTTLYSPAWSTNGAFNTFYSFQNTTGAALTGTLTLLDTAGVVLSSFPVPVPAGQTSSTNTSSLSVARNRTGTARFVHDGPPGAVTAEAAIANFSITPSYIQPVKFQATREAR